MKSIAIVVTLVCLTACSGKKSRQAPEAEPVPVAAPHDAAVGSKLGDAPAPEVVINAITKYDPHVLSELQLAMAACKWVSEHPDQRYADAVRGAVTAALPPLDPGHGVRAACAEAVGAIGGEAAVDTLMVVVSNADEPIPVTSGAVAGLGRLGDERAVAPIVQSMLRNARLLDAGRTALAHMRMAAVPALIATLEGKTKVDAAPGTVAFAVARALGDLRAPEALPALVASLRAEPQAAMVSRKGEAGPTHHVAVIEALRKIGTPTAARALADYWKRTREPSLRTQALDAYGLVAPDDAHAKELLALFSDDTADVHNRIAAGLAYGRVARSQDAVSALATLPFALAADPANKRLHLVAVSVIARAWVGAHCKGEAACVTDLLKKDPAALSTAIVAAIPAGDGLTANERADLATAAQERALIDLRRLAQSSTMDVVLSMVGSSKRLVHQAALDALFTVTTSPCGPCMKPLEAAIAVPADGDPIQMQMRYDTEIARAVLATPVEK